MRTSLVHIRLLLQRLGLVLLLLSAFRVAFYIANAHAFPAPSAVQALAILVQGVRFDASTVVMANALFILLHLLPLPGRGRAGYQRMLFILFLVTNTLVLLICGIDLVFYGFSNKRVTRDLLGQLEAGARTAPGFLLHYWWATLTFLAAVGVLWRGYRRATADELAVVAPVRAQAVAFVVAGGLLFLVGRGGWQYQGLSPAHAADHVEVAFAPLVTNSAFTFLHSLAGPELRERAYFDAAELDRRLPLRYVLQADSTDTRTNVVFIIVESLGREYLGSIGGEKGYLPFLDSLAERSLVFTNAFANAERSNKSMCALLAGIPSFTDDAFMNTAYADGRVDGLGTRMKEMGYRTSFYHGGLNGEYRFDSFSRACGFDRYYGKDEYGDDSAYDGHWGIYDEEFLQFFADGLDREPEPFCSVVFTLSSHDPFPIPERWQGRFPRGTQEIHASLGYVDMALRRFFQRVERAPWYPRTLFVITGDHTFAYNVHPPWYHNPAGRFAVPIIFHRGDGSLRGRDSTLAQHLDIGPSILDLTGYSGAINTFGRSLFRQDRAPYAVEYLDGQYQIIADDRLLSFDGERTTGLHAYRTDTLFARDLRAAEPARAEDLRQRLEAVIQRHATALRDNTLQADPEGPQAGSPSRGRGFR